MADLHFISVDRRVDPNYHSDFGNKNRFGLEIREYGGRDLSR
jgi:hypothetical protein